MVGVAEVSVYAAYLRKVGDSRRRERERRMGRKERKVVVGREEVGRGARGGGRKGSGDVKEKEGEDGNGDVEEIEIWGRGVNGGVRRRVRERWEKDREKELELEVEKKEKGVEEAK